MSAQHTSSPRSVSRPDDWPALDYAEWKDTYATLHMWTQIVGKIRLARTPWVNHSWHVALYVTPRGLTTSPIPDGVRIFQIDFDFIAHQLVILTSDGGLRTLALRPRTVANFYDDLMTQLAELGIDVQINTTPNEVVDGIPFERDTEHSAYDAQYANRFWRALVQADRVFKQFRTRFIGKCSPVHFFWGSFDLAVTRFSGRPAPEHPGGVPHLPDWVAREAYSHEVTSCGFWPGGGPVPYPVFYAYAYPEPEGFRGATLCGNQARYDATLHEFLLPYDAVRQAESPDALLLAFMQDSYDTAARCGKWDRRVCEREHPLPVEADTASSS
ncbi:hypothetical protein E4K72_16330 [Oxalobacteraceae bacterium OM1]|nr:hypothetical protein E4K72_16330 [Oxalobacteraceae bacterium OM1]